MPVQKISSFYYKIELPLLLIAAGLVGLLDGMAAFSVLLGGFSYGLACQVTKARYFSFFGASQAPLMLRTLWLGVMLRWGLLALAFFTARLVDLPLSFVLLGFLMSLGLRFVDYGHLAFQPTAKLWPH